MKAKPVAFGPLTMIPGDKRSRFPFCNSLFIEDAGLIIDPSCNRKVIETLHNQHKLRVVCLTHWHEDHFRYLHLLDECCLWMSEADSIPLADSREFLRWYGLDVPGADSIRKMIKFKLEREIRFKPGIPDRLMADGETIDLGSSFMEVIASPGHSPGHLSYFFPEQSVLFLGDYNMDSFGPWTGDPNSDIDECIATIHRLRQVPAEILIAGHLPEPILDNNDALWDSYLLTISAREEKLAGFLKEPHTRDEVIDQWLILGEPGEPVDYFRFAEQAHVEKHLARMVRQGVVQNFDGLYQRV